LIRQILPVQLPATPSRFALMLHERLRGRYAHFAQTCGAFVIVAVMENATADVLRAVVAELAPLLPALAKDARAGATLLAQYVRANGGGGASSSSSTTGKTKAAGKAAASTPASSASASATAAAATPGKSSKTKAAAATPVAETSAAAASSAKKSKK
jgi:hypothetical protein